MPAAAVACPCGSGVLLPGCCAPLIDGKRGAKDALALMRSRYTAYTLQNEAYLLATWHSDTRPAALDLQAGPMQKWLELQVLRHSTDASDPARAVVEFVARYKVNGRAFRLHEISCFVFEDGRWFYFDGELS
jgi:SEC-C motif domain protein